MTQKRKLTLGYIPYGNGSSIDPFDTLFDEAKDVLKDGFANVDAVILWGGEDWHPSYYNEKPHFWNGKKDTNPSIRDVAEWKTMLFCKHHKIPMIGVCRGAQGLCIAAGGKLVQHVDNHGRNHLLETYDKKEIWANSTHHQMMYPYDIPHELLAWTTFNQSRVYEDAKGEMPEMKGKKEPEIVYFPTINSIAIQGHPEYSTAPMEFVEYCRQVVKDFLDLDANVNAKGFQYAR